LNILSYKNGLAKPFVLEFILPVRQNGQFRKQLFVGSELIRYGFEVRVCL